MTVLFILPKTVSLQKQALLLYYLYCLCKSLQRSLLLCRLSFQESGCKGKNFQAYLPNIFGSFFFIFPFSRHLSCERENKGKVVLPTRIQEKVSTNAAYFLKAGAKVRTLFHIFQMFPEVFFHSAFSKGNFRKKQVPSRRNM